MEQSIHIDRVVHEDRDVVLVSLSRIDAASLSQLEQFIADESPDTVCLGIDEQRFEWTSDRDGRDPVDLVEIIRSGQTHQLSSYLAMSAIQRKLADFVGVLPGEEMQVAAQAAQACGAEVATVGRSMVTTCLRAWRLSSRWHRTKLSWLLVRGLFKRTDIPDALPEGATERLEQVWAELAGSVPLAWEAFIGESSRYMTGRLQEVEGDKIIVVTSPAHVPRIRERLEQRPDPLGPNAGEQAGFERARLDHIPKIGLISRALPWVVTVVIIGLFVGGFAYGDVSKVQDALLAWVLCNGILGGLGALLSLAHPITIAAVFVAAPIVSLNPAVGAGMVGSLVQAIVVPPTLRDMERVGDDLSHWSGWWRNRLARLLVIFVLANVGSTIGTFLALAWLPDVF